MAEAICLRCGVDKHQPWSACRSCNYDPMSDEEALVKSVYLSVGRFEDGDERREYQRELDEVARDIQQGHDPEFDEAELQRLRAQKADVESVPASTVWNAAFRLFLPGVGILVLLFCILMVLKALA